MKNRISNAVKWMGRLMLVALLVVTSAAAALAFDVSGTVSNPTGKSGRVYLVVQSTMYGGALAGVSIPSASPAGTSYTIRGLTDPGSYYVSAFVDTQDTAVRHANDPVGISGVFSEASASDVNLTMALPSPAVALQAPLGANVIYGDTTATIFYDGASDNNGQPIATSYNIYWSTDPNPGPGNTTGGGSITGLPSGSKDFFVRYGLTNPTSQYNFAITAVLDGAESAPVNADPAPSATGVTVSGTVTTSGPTLPGGGTHLLMVLINDSEGVFITHSLANPTNSQAFSISGVPPGTYNLYSIIDLNNNGIIDQGDIFDTERGVSVTVDASDVSGVAVPLTAADALPFVQTTHYNGGGYSLSLGVSGMQERPVNVAVSGPQIPTRDLGLDTYGNGIFETWQSVASRPNFPASPDTYSFTIEYSPGNGTSPLTAPITGIVDYFATPTSPTGVISIPAPDPLQFSWAAPSPAPPYSYNYDFRLNNPNGYFDNDPYWNIPSSTTSINISGNDFMPQQGVYYNWAISIKDSYGNSSESSANFSAGGFGSISGMVTSDGSNGIANTFAVLLDSLTGKPATNVPAVLTDNGNGGFYINNVPPGNYKVYFSAGPGFQSEFYNDQTNFGSAQLLTVLSEQNLNNVNAILSAAPNTGTIVGHVANAANGQPVINAMVELLNSGNSSLVTQIYTTSSGDFQISAINPGSYKLRISANGYRTIAPVSVYLVQSGVSTQVSISLSNTVTYTSRVVDSASAPIANALVEVVGGTTSILTDSNGYFTITVPVSTNFYLRISKATFVTTYTSTMSFSQDSDTSDRPYSLLTGSSYDGMFSPTSPNSVAKIAGTGSISARVASAGNQLMTLPGATVSASDGTTSYPVCYNDGSVNCSLTSTKDNGRFYVLNVPDGKQITVTVTKGGYNSGSRVFPVFADSASLGRVGLQTSTTSTTMISKLINFTTGAPIANNTVTLIKDSDNLTVGQVSTDNSGLFTVADLLSGSNYYLKLSDGTSYLESYSANTSAPGSNADRSGRPYYTFTSSPNQITSWGFSTFNAVITGTIKDGLTGQPIAGATISAKIGTTDITTIKYDDGSGNPSSSATATSAANGRFYIYNIPASSSNSNTTVTVTVTAAPGYNISGGGGAAPKTYHVKNGTLSQGGFTLNLTSPPTMVGISGSVTDLFSLPLSGARVAAYLLSPTWSMLGNPTLTDSTGKFTVNVPSGIPFALEFISFGKRTAYSQDIQISQSTSTAPFPLLTNNDYSLLGWPLTAGKTFIRGMALDNLLRPLDGVVVTPNPGSYTINYVNDADNRTLTSGGATFTNGLFVLKDAIPTDPITLTASKTGRSFFPASFSHMVADTDSLGGAFDSTPAPGFLSANPSFLNYGNLSVGGGPLSQPVNLINSGPGSILVSSINLSGDTGDFSIVPGGTCPALPGTLPTGDCTVQVNFSPTTTGSRAATLNISSNATSGSNYAVSLSGYGTATTPGAPSITSVNPWDGQATVNFNPPAFDGGSQITGYRVIVNPGPITVTVPGPANPITISGLTNGIEYAFWIAAINDVGTGPDSTPAAIATPYYAPIRIGSVGYADLETTISTVAVDGEIYTQTGAATVRNPPTSAALTLTKGLKISGGWNSDYSASAVTVNDYTVIPVRVDIKGTGFKVILKNVKVKAP